MDNSCGGRAHSSIIKTSVRRLVSIIGIGTTSVHVIGGNGHGIEPRPSQVKVTVYGQDVKV